MKQKITRFTSHRHSRVHNSFIGITCLWGRRSMMLQHVTFWCGGKKQVEFTTGSRCMSHTHYKAEFCFSMKNCTDFLKKYIHLCTCPEGTSCVCVFLIGKLLNVGIKTWSLRTHIWLMNLLWEAEIGCTFLTCVWDRNLTNISHTL